MANEMYSLQERVFLYDSYVKTSCAKQTQKLFRKKFLTEQVPSKKSIDKLVKHVRKTGELMDLKKKTGEKKHKKGSQNRKKVPIETGVGGNEVSIKSEPMWIEENEAVSSEDSESSNEEMYDKLEPSITLLEAVTETVLVKQEPHMYLEEDQASGNEADLDMDVKTEIKEENFTIEEN